MALKLGDNYIASSTVTGDTLPLGTVVEYLGTTAPVGWEVTTQSDIMTAYNTGRPVVNIAVAFSNTKIPLNGSRSIGTKLTFDDANDRIIVGAGVSFVKVSCKVNVWTTPVAVISEVDVQLRKNGATVGTCLQSRVTSQAFNDESITDSLIPVVQNDYFEIHLVSSQTGNFTLIGDTYATYLTVEVVE